MCSLIRRTENLNRLSLSFAQYFRIARKSTFTVYGLHVTPVILKVCHNFATYRSVRAQDVETASKLNARARRCLISERASVDKKQEQNTVEISFFETFHWRCLPIILFDEFGVWCFLETNDKKECKVGKFLHCGLVSKLRHCLVYLQFTVAHTCSNIRLLRPLSC
jgi:hypothetical protein